LSAKETKKEHKGRLRTAFFLALIGGILMLIAGATGGIGIYAFAYAEISLYYPQIAGLIGIILPVLTIIASFGGAAVIVGGFLLLGGRVTTGKLLITLGAGFGLLGLIIGTASGLAQGWGLQASIIAVFATGTLVGWVGIFLSIFARFAAKK